MVRRIRPADGPGRRGPCPVRRPAGRASDLDRRTFLARFPGLETAAPIREREALDVVVRWNVAQQCFEASCTDVSALAGVGPTSDSAVKELEVKLLERLRQQALVRDTKVIQTRRLELVIPSTTM
jgi:hypothetical protein